MTPLPPLGHLFGATARGGVTATRTWSTETVEAVFPDGTVQVRGQRIPTSGRAVLVVGARVPVLWSGGQPAIVAQHSVRRGGALIVTEEGYAVEELFLYEAATDQPAGAQWDVYFRNDAQVTRLNLHAIINADRQTSWNFGAFGPNQTGVLKIGWGQADHTFWVMTLAHDGVDALSSRWWPRFYAFRLSRAEGQPAGGAPVTATLAATVDLPVFTMPGKYASVSYTFTPDLVTTSVTPTFPYLPPSALGAAEIILEPSLTIVIVVPHVLIRDYVTLNPAAPATYLEQIAYLFAVRSDTSAILWESPVSDAFRDSSSPDVPDLPDDTTTNPACLVQLLGFAVMDWSATDATRRLIATSWDVFHATIVASFGNDPTEGSAQVNRAQRGVFVETGGPLPLHTIQPWTSYQVDPLIAGGGTFAESEPTRTIVTPAATDQVLLTGLRIAATGPTAFETRVERWTGGALTVLASRPATDGKLAARAAALRLFQARTVYVVDENAATAPAESWPTAEERGRFTSLAGDLPLTIGAVLPNDAAHQGPLKTVPVGVTAPDGLTYQFFAYHIVGTIT